MLGVSEEHIIEEDEGARAVSEKNLDTAVTLYHNQSDPLVVVDGIDLVTIVDEGEEPYLVEYRGMMVGAIRVTEDGLVELGSSLLGDRNAVPEWYSRSPEDLDPVPWWAPDDYTASTPVACDHCGTERPPERILTPGSYDGDTTDRFCRDCWNDVHHRWDPETGLRAPPTVERAKELRGAVSNTPKQVELGEVRALIEADDPNAQREALLAVDSLIEERPDDALELLPVLVSLLDHDDHLVHVATLFCLSSLAEEYPRQLTIVADRVVELVGPDVDGGVLEGALPYIAAVADVEPRTVIDAAPRLAALLQTDHPCEGQTILALTRIAKVYPDTVAPVADDLLQYVEIDGSNHRVNALAALGHIAKEYPNVAESAIPALLELLDAESYLLRANAAGLLAELADEYPAALRSAVPRIVDLLDDDDEKARYNATSILSRTAQAHPEAVSQATGPLIDALDEEFAYSRSNACWALGHLEAAEARDRLEDLHESDPDEEVRTAAGWALEQLDVPE
jgi:hypothetical protein